MSDRDGTGAAHRTDGSHRRRSRRLFVPLLVAILLLSAWLRLPGLSWGDGLPDAPVGFTFHPDEPKFVRQARLFQAGPTAGHVYVGGWAAHGFVVAGLARTMAGIEEPELLDAFRHLSLLYGLLTVVLVGVVGRAAFRNPELGLWGAAFLGLTGLHVVNSHFGTPDAAAAFAFTLTIVAAYAYVRRRGHGAFLTMCVAAGAALALKLQLGVLPLVALACVLDRRRWSRSLLAAALVLATFEAMNLFGFSPQDLRDVARMLNAEVVRQARHDYGFNLGRPLRGLVPALGFGIFGFLVIGVISLGHRGARLLPKRPLRAWPESPWTWFLLASGSHLLLLAFARAQSPRQATVLMPTACLVAARGVVELRRRLAGRPPWRRIAIVIVALTVVYQVATAREIESAFRRDPRIEASRWLSARADPGQEVTAYFHYSRIPGNYELVEHPADWVLTTSLEYRRYLGKTDPADVLRGGGAERLHFWNRLFDGELDYERAREFKLAVRVPEWRLAPIAHWYGAESFTFVPTSVVIFQRRTGSRGDERPEGGSSATPAGIRVPDTGAGAAER